MKTGKMLVGSAVAAFLVAMAALALATGPESGQGALTSRSSGVRVAASSSPSPTPSSSPSSTPSPEGTFDISGPCDEAEHVNDPRCAGVQVPTGGPQVGGIDISGPCDEAEHVNDPRCTQPSAGDDRSGPSHGEQDDRSGSSNDGNDEDNSRPSGNSGPGSSSDD